MELIKLVMLFAAGWLIVIAVNLWNNPVSYIPPSLCLVFACILLVMLFFFSKGK